MSKWQLVRALSADPQRLDPARPGVVSQHDYPFAELNVLAAGGRWYIGDELRAKNFIAQDSHGEIVVVHFWGRGSEWFKRIIEHRSQSGIAAALAIVESTSKTLEESHSMELRGKRLTEDLFWRDLEERVARNTQGGETPAND